MDKNCKHSNIDCRDNREYYFFTLSIPNISSINDIEEYTQPYKMKNGYTYCGYITGSEEKITFAIASSGLLKCFVSMFIGPETLLLSNSLDKPTHTTFHNTYTYSYDIIKLSSGDENYEKLKQHPNDTAVFICRIIYSENSNFSTTSVKAPHISTNIIYNLKMFAADLKLSSMSLSKEKVILRVGKDTETVSKAVLCARSPVFAKMFESDMKEKKKMTVTIGDIKMPVLKVLIAYMYTGEFSICDSDEASSCDLDFLCELYYAADKYQIHRLRQRCMHLLLPQISMENIGQVMKLPLFYTDALLKSTVVALIATNIEKWCKTDDWKNLVNNEPNIAEEVMKFLDL